MRLGGFVHKPYWKSLIWNITIPNKEQVVVTCMKIRITYLQFIWGRFFKIIIAIELIDNHEILFWKYLWIDCLIPFSNIFLEFEVNQFSSENPPDETCFTKPFSESFHVRIFTLKSLSSVSRLPSITANSTLDKSFRCSNLRVFSVCTSDNSE